MKIHPVVGAEILEHVRFPYPVVPIVRAHHEKWNGSGYHSVFAGRTSRSEREFFGGGRAGRASLRPAIPPGAASERSHGTESCRTRERLRSGCSRDTPAALRGAGKEGAGGQFGTIKLSLDLKIERGAAPAAGFIGGSGAQVFGEAHEPLSFLDALAAARANIQAVFESAYENGGCSLDELFSLLAVRMKRLVPHDAFAVYLVRDERLIPQYVTGDNYRLFSSLRIPLGQGLSGWVAENRKPILNGNPSVESGYLNNPSIFSTLRSAIAVPLICFDQA